MADIIVVRGADCQLEASSGAMTRLVGVSQALAGAQGIHMAVAVIPPGGRSSPHWHTNCESAIYILKGKGRFLTGDDLRRELPFQEGDFIYVPAEALHQPVNDGDVPVKMVVARNASVETVREYLGPPP